MTLFLAGYQADRVDRSKYLIDSGIMLARCFSFVNVHKVPGIHAYYLPRLEEGYRYSMDRGVKIMMDSGVFSYRSRKLWLQRAGKDLSGLPGEQEFLELYAAFCKKYSKRWSLYVSVDFEKHAAKNIVTHKKLMKMGINPAPVVHGDDDVLKYMQMYRDMGCTYMCTSVIGWALKTQRQHLDAIFNVATKLGIELHGLAMTKVWCILGFPWRSCDSSTWSRSAGFGCILRFDEKTQRMYQIKVSDVVGKSEDGNPRSTRMPVTGRFLEMLKAELKEEGYDYRELQTSHLERHRYNASTMLKLAEAVNSQERRWRVLV